MGLTDQFWPKINLSKIIAITVLKVKFDVLPSKPEGSRQGSRPNQDMDEKFDFFQNALHTHCQ